MQWYCAYALVVRHRAQNKKIPLLFNNKRRMIMPKGFTISTEGISVLEYITTHQNDRGKIQRRTAPEREWEKVELTEEERWFLDQFDSGVLNSIIEKFTQAGFDLATSLSHERID